MAKKLVLVPEDMYRGLLSSSNARENLRTKGFEQSGSTVGRQERKRDDDGEINLEFTRKNMIKARDQKGKLKNISAKNIAYNQELRRYLRFRKEMKEKPIKVKLSNGANVVVKGSNGQDDSQIETALLNDDGDLETTVAPNTESSRLFETPRSSRVALRAVRASARERNEGISRRLSGRIQKKKKSSKSELPLLEKKQILLRYLYANSEKLGLTKKGEVLRSMGGVPMKTSNLEMIVEHLLDASGPGSSSPTGTNILRSRLAKDQNFNKLISNLKEGGSKELIDSAQYGKGYFDTFKERREKGIRAIRPLGRQAREQSEWSKRGKENIVREGKYSRRIT